MLAVFLPPYPFRGVKAPYLWTFYKYINCITEPILFIIGDDYLNIIKDGAQLDRWEYYPASMASLGYSLPNDKSIMRHEYLYLDNGLYEKLLSRYHQDPIKAFSVFLTERIPELETELHILLDSRRDLVDQIDNFISICNCPSLEFVAQALGKQVMHIEIGPLRAPMYCNTAYLDFSGVNGKTEASERYQKCQSELNIKASLDDLHRYFLDALPAPEVTSSLAAGLVLQVEDDSNLIAYNQGFTNISLISHVRQLYEKDQILVRAHPGSLFRLRNNAFAIDASANSLDFINKCKEVFTINSSVGLEALLTGKKTTILGDCSYSFINELADATSRVNATAFYLFAYLVPFELVFNQEYLNFRLSQPQEQEIVAKHLEFYSTEGRAGAAGATHTLSSLINEAVSQGKAMRNILEKSLQENQKQLDLLKNQLLAEVAERERLMAERVQLQRNIEVMAHSKAESISVMERMRNSLSWKLTMPIRMSGRIFRGEFSTVKQMTRDYLLSCNGRLSRLLLSSGLLSKSKYKTALRLILSGHWKLAADGFKRVMCRLTTAPTPVLCFDNDDVRILATQHTLFVAHLIEKGLQDNGITAHTSTLYAAEHDHDQLHIVICPQMFSQLPKRYIVFQMEQSVNSRWFTKSYFACLNNAEAIFDYSLKNIEYLLQQGFPYQKLFYMPISSYADYPAYLAKIGYDLSENQDGKTAEILFYGDIHCERRKAYLQELKKHFNVTVASEVFGDRLTKMVKDARVVVNIHYYENALLETTRLYETLSLGTPIVSESSVDIEEHQDLQSVIDFCPAGDIQSMVEKLHTLLSDERRYREKLATIAKFTTEDSKNNLYLKRYLLSIDKIRFQQYENSFNFNAIKERDIPRLCLSLSETPKRRKAFFECPSHGFRFFDGLRHRIGWIGCGMSYKYMLSKMLASPSEMVIICEDDVIFPPDYDKNLNKVLYHLQTNEIEWHIFSGIIAHLHDDTRIIDVKKIDGIEYIYIDKMTSMVMNIYSRKGMALISQWDEKNIDSDTNTIDRYVESSENLVVVTTIPFLVGYAQEQQSTLWGFENSQYTSLIENSEKLLAKKVAEFKSKHKKEREC